MISAMSYRKNPVKKHTISAAKVSVRGGLHWYFFLFSMWLSELVALELYRKLRVSLYWNYCE